EAGVRQGKNGSIEVDDRLRTSRAGTYAAGDVTGRDQFVYMAAYGAKLAAKNALNSDSLAYDNRAMPGIVFTDPQVATVGLTEVQAKAAGIWWRPRCSRSTMCRARSRRATRAGSSSSSLMPRAASCSAPTFLPPKVATAFRRRRWRSRPG